jgi:hypothetical protein
MIRSRSSKRAAAVEVVRAAHAGGDEQRAVALRAGEDGRELRVVAAGHPDLDDRAQLEQQIDVRAPVEVLERERVAHAAQLLDRAEHVVARRIRRHLQDRAVRAHRRRADLDEEVARDRHPRGMAAGQDLQADVAEGVHEQGGGGLGVRRGIERLPFAAEHELIPDDPVALVGDGLAHDGDIGTGGGVEERRHIPHGRQVGPES